MVGDSLMKVKYKLSDEIHFYILRHLKANVFQINKKFQIFLAKKKSQWYGRTKMILNAKLFNELFYIVRWVLTIYSYITLDILEWEEDR